MKEEMKLKIHAKCKLHFLKKVIAVILVLNAIFIFDVTALKAAGRKGVISGCPSLVAFSGPGSSYDVITTDNGKKIILPSGYEVIVLSETYTDELWYYVSFTYNNNQRYTGYVRGRYVSVSSDGSQTMTDEEFEQYLIAEGFPEDYRKYLRAIHAEHPLWVFEAQHTNLDWEASVEAESIVGKNLIPNDSPVSWKSMAEGAYNKATGSWIVFDGKDWVAASKELIAYYMDPRNFLNDVNIFQFEVLSYNSSYQTAEGVEAILAGSFMEGSYVDTDGWAATYAEAFIYAAEQSGVSPFHLASRALQELGYNGSNSVSGNVAGYEGIFNFYNIGATSSSNPIINGLEFASQINSDYFLPWNTKWKSIAGGAMYLGKRYINVGQDTLYLQKFNVQGTNPYNHQYMTNVQAPSAEAGRLSEAYETSLERAIVFKIPIYLNMPAENAPLPTETEVNTDNPGTNTGTGDEGEPNTDPGPSDEPVDYSGYTINGSDYGVDAKSYVLQKLSDNESVITYIYGFEMGQSAGDALALMTPVDCSIKILNSDKTVNEGIISTGNILQISSNDDGSVLREIPIVIFGDVTGDGALDGKDMLYMCRHILGISTLTGVYAEAADVRWDTTVLDSQGAKTSDITGVDMLYIQRHLLGIAYITQK